jgi:GT2 family glycosyltransferase
VTGISVQPPEGTRPGSGSRGRVRVEGKFFARGGERIRVRGVTYGPFEPGADGQPFPRRSTVLDDLARMRAAGINSIRTYRTPPAWMLDLAGEQGVSVLLDVPWPKHVCFLDSEEARASARRAVRNAAAHSCGHRALLAYSIANEVPPDVVRWHGARRVERFLGELVDVAKQTDPEGLVTYANFPPTEYLDLDRLDFATFNVYLHSPETFRRYLLRLQNLAGDKPLVLGEIGMDTLRHGEDGQARFLAGQVAEALLGGLSGAFIFSWTDDWFTGGNAIEDWAFGITRRDRTPKASYHALGRVFDGPLSALLVDTPRVSVVVCSYNGGKTLDACLRSLLELDYPDYEVILVDDGSTDDTRAIAARYAPSVRTVRQENQGLSVARNVGLREAAGEVIAYTDSDCVADPDWLTLFVHQLETTGAAAVGGPNLSPEDGRVAACVAASPGQPAHVLESDQVAEHVPGCNMAFRREALEAINGFDPVYRKAGDDVDVCWRLQQAGMWITYAPGAFVWHHRRQTPLAYLKQQAGYGEAEALLRFKHPDRFNGRGDGRWRGVMYGGRGPLRGLRLTDSVIYRGTFGTGLFQCVYQPGTAHWAMLPSTLEWQVAAALAALAGAAWPAGWAVAAVMLTMSVAVAAVQAIQARLTPAHDGVRSRCLVVALCYLQPLVRSWSRYRTRLFAYRHPDPPPEAEGYQAGPTPLTGVRCVEYWSEQGVGRTDLLGLAVAYLDEHRWGKVIDSGWSDWDLEVYCDRWTVVRISSAQEEHGGKSLIRVRFRALPGRHVKLAAASAMVAAMVAAAFGGAPAGVTAAVLIAACAAVWRRGTRRAAALIAVMDGLADRLRLVRCGAPEPWEVPDVSDRPAPVTTDMVVVGEG